MSDYLSLTYLPTGACRGTATNDRGALNSLEEYVRTEYGLPRQIIDDLWQICQLRQRIDKRREVAGRFNQPPNIAEFEREIDLLENKQYPIQNESFVGTLLIQVKDFILKQEHSAGLSDYEKEDTRPPDGGGD